MKNVLITGASGFIGSQLCFELSQRGYTVLKMGRSKGGDNAISWLDNDDEILVKIEGVHGIIHLAGESVAGGLFTSKRKNKILSSRVETGKRLVSLVSRLNQPPEFFFQASAVGFYGSNIKNSVTEQAPQGQGFLADVCADWESSTLNLEELGICRAVGRIGIVLGHGGFLGKVASPMKLFAGGHLGDGSNYIPWIHLEDCIRIIIHLLENQVSGIFNLTANSPVPSREFFQELGSALGRPSWLHVPKFALNLAGEFGKEVLLASQNVLPEAIGETGYSFKFKDLPAALQDIYSS